MPGLGIRRRLFDTFDSLYLGISGKNLPPRSLRAYVGRIEDFERVPQETLSELARKTLKDLLHSLGSVGKWHHYDGYSTISAEKLEAMIAYKENAVTAMLERCSLQKVKIYGGAWSRRQEYLSFQGIIIVRKP